MYVNPFVQTFRLTRLRIRFESVVNFTARRICSFFFFISKSLKNRVPAFRFTLNSFKLVLERLMVQLATDTRVIDEKYVCNSGECPSRRTAVVIEKKMFYYFLALRLRFERSIGKSVFNILKPVNRLCLSVKKLKTNICLIHFMKCSSPRFESKTKLCTQIPRGLKQNERRRGQGHARPKRKSARTLFVAYVCGSIENKIYSRPR